jgi:type III secretory pathway component EscS
VSPELRDMLLVSFNLFFLVGIPIVGAVVAASLLVAFFERLTGIKDASLGLMIRLAAGIAISVALWERFWGLLQQLGKQAFG